MWYIQQKPDETGNYGAPQTPEYEGSIALPDALLQPYIDSMGFVNVTVENGTVTLVKRNEEAYNAYIASLPPPEPPVPTPEETRDSLLVDHELRITMLELGI